MRKKIFISGVFNVVHPGHMRLFKFAKSLGNYLIVGVLSNKKLQNDIYLNDDLRLENLKTNSLIDKVILIENDIKEIIKKIKPTFVVKGKEHENKKNEEEKIIKKYGGELVFSSGDPSLISYETLEKKFLKDKENFLLPADYLNRHHISKDNIIADLKNIKKLKICVLGDAIVDKYIECKHLGISQESPSLVVSPVSKKKFLGGAGIVAAHCSGLGAKVDFFTVLGKDSNANFVRDKCLKYNVRLIKYFDSTRPTTLKTRYITDKKTLLKVTNLNNSFISSSIQNKIIKMFKSKVSKYDLVILSDFNYGLFTKNLIKNIIKIALKNKCIVTADSQSSSQIGDITKFKKIDLITPTEHESRIALKNSSDGLVILAKELIKKTDCKYALIKLGSDGVIIQSKKKVNNFITDILPPLNHSPIDTSGAGDSMLAGVSISLTQKNNIWKSVLVGSLLSAIQVERMGNIPIKIQEVLSKL